MPDNIVGRITLWVGAAFAALSLDKRLIEVDCVVSKLAWTVLASNLTIARPCPRDWVLLSRRGLRKNQRIMRARSRCIRFGAAYRDSLVKSAI